MCVVTWSIWLIVLMTWHVPNDDMDINDVMICLFQVDDSGVDSEEEKSDNEASDANEGDAEHDEFAHYAARAK